MAISNPLKHPHFEEEKELWKNYDYVIGIDEVGRGSWAGPVVVAGVIFEKNCHLLEDAVLKKLFSEVNDSKLIKPHIRDILSILIQEKCLVFAIEKISVSIINKKGIGKATYMGMRKVVTTIRKKIKDTNTFILVDGLPVKRIPGGIKNQKAIVKGDQKSISIAAASIIAKVYRDNLMAELDTKYTVYKFSQNKGYGTKFHQKALKKYGLSKVHRKSFNLDTFLNSGKV